MSIMKIGFTGTRQGCTEEQLKTLSAIFASIGLSAEHQPELHHGDCVGADAQAVELANAVGFWTVCHPPTNPKLRARLTSDEIRLPFDYLDRNHNIVNETDLLIVCPKNETEELRSGTWATYRYARRRGKMIVLIVPSGIAHFISKED